MKKIIILLIVILFISNIDAQEKLRVAVLDPVCSEDIIDAGTKIAIREIISSTIVNIGEYGLVERSMLERVMEELVFSNSGIVDDSQATEIGKLAGANKVVLSIITVAAGRYMLSVKMIDVKTAAIEKQQVKIVLQSEIIDIIEPIAFNMFGRSNKSSEPPILDKNDYKQNNNHTKEKTFNIVEQVPMFPGGVEALMKYIQKNLKYPSDAREKYIQGKVIVGFIISKDGSIQDVKIKTGLYPSLNKEAIRIVKSLPKFIPANQNGTPVSMHYILPINFRLE